MGVTIGNELSTEVLALLQGDRAIVLATVDDQGWPDTAPFSWAVAVDLKTVRVAVNEQVETLRNIRRNGRVRLCVTGGGMTVSVRGHARVVREHMTSTPLATAMVEIHVDEVKNDDVMGRVDGEKLRWDRRHAVAADAAVVAELRSVG
ncbi:MAG: pyridoxamine 5'-phosphate oxidase family protein [Chloroflexi bacterium]|nr:pyridoxamine 5'-phosphate oxidase family protein [Chloroflexota bacterium]MBI4504292.1 pyridoxamine 5'-phosphate oxidase family protein [Chloroflexota bacterium]